ncbi:MAG: hypothetical protein M1816_007256 [Peltula sp. TS41687]|nr:MAG: hypothetical protein M1816_007256 [Peltula sp. TS41687]
MHFLFLQLLLTLAYVRQALSYPSSGGRAEQQLQQDDSSSSSPTTTSSEAVGQKWILPAAAGGLSFLGYLIGDKKGEHRGVQKGYQLGWKDLGDFQCVHECVEEKKGDDEDIKADDFSVASVLQLQIYDGPEDDFDFVFDDEKAQTECLDACRVGPESVIRRTPVAVREQFFNDGKESKTSNHNDGYRDGIKKIAEESDKASDGTTTHHFSLPERLKNGVDNVLGVLGRAGGRNDIVMPSPLGFKTPLGMNVVP